MTLKTKKMSFYKCAIICFLHCFFSTVFISATESHIYSDNNNKLKPLDYNETLSPVIEDLNTLSPCSINVIWSCDQCADFGLSSFIVYWSDGTDGNYEVNDTTFSYVINGLDAATNYSVIVSAVYEDDNEYESDTDYASTEIGDPPDIYYINIESVNATTIKLSWNTTNQDCPIEKYDVQFAGPVLCTVGRTDSGGEITAETSTTLTGLIPYTEYNITIAAIATDDTYGNVNFKEGVITDEDVPGTPEKLVSVPLNSSSMNVDWEQPLECNGILLDYTVSWKLAENDTIVGSDTTTELTYQVNNLLECGDYEFFVNASTSKGIGNAATTSSSTLPEAPPPVGIFESENVTSRSVNLSWTTPDTHCPYNYTLDLTGTVLWDDQVVTGEVIVPGNDTSYEADNLIPWTNYLVCITATTEGGSSEPICTEFQTLEDVPGMPENLTAVEESITSDGFKITWNEPIVKNGQITRFKVTLNNKESYFVNYEEPGTTYEMTFNDLSLSYNVVDVFAETSVGFGRPAELPITLQDDTDDSNLGLILGITIPLIVIIIAASVIGYYYRDNIRTRVKSFRS